MKSQYLSSNWVSTLLDRRTETVDPPPASSYSTNLADDCVLDGRPRTLRLATGDPIFPMDSPRYYDSHLEERFAREFRRAAPDWDLVREPKSFAAGDAPIFPDFALDVDPTPGAEVALRDRLILCIDEARSCASADLAPGTRVVRFRRRVNPAAVLFAVGASPDSVDS